MCSIIGYIGNNTAAPIIVQGLQRMEYRGYDSVGVATISENKISLRKGVGKVSLVNGEMKLDSLYGTIGIGHTRWATNGLVSKNNAHPHPSNSKEIAIVHNGIIDNFIELKKFLTEKGYFFKSETDSEVISNLLQFHFDKTHDVYKSMILTSKELKGNFTFVAAFSDGTIAASRFHEPLIIGVNKDGYFLSSDILGFIEYADEVIYPENGEIVIINQNGLQMFDFRGTPTSHQITKVSKEFVGVYKGEYAHFTMKEISEQPLTILKAAKKTTLELDMIAMGIKKAKHLYITGSGTSYNACLVAKHLFSKYAKLKIEPILSSEAPFSTNLFDDESITLAISQSGESADVLEAVNIAKMDGSKIFSIVNVMTSSLVNLSDISIGLNCGPEIGVAATKSFTSQLAVLYQITNKLCEGSLNLDFNNISGVINKILSDQSVIKNISKKLKGVSDIYVLGRGIHYAIASEASLKLKELTYIHAEGIAGGELKHGPLALMDSNTYVVMINPSDSTYDDTLTSAREIKARGAKIIGISDKNSDVYDHWIKIPSVDEMYYPLIEIIPIQLLAYYAAIEKDTDPDYPRNLAKSVTVK